MAETYARAFPCGCFVELDIAYDWVDGQISIEEVSVKECGGLTTHAADGARFCPECKALLEEHSVYCDNCGTDTPRR